jgi:thioredoxin reductase (NADPH)
LPFAASGQLLLAVDADFHQLGRTEAELSRAFGADYRVRGELSPEDALRTLQDADRRNERVAVVLVDEKFSDDARSEIFAKARTLHPNARRALLVPWGAWAHLGSAQKDPPGAWRSATSATTCSSRGLGAMNSSTVRSRSSCWSGHADPTNLREVVVVAERHSGRAYEVSDLLSRNGIPHIFWVMEGRERMQKLLHLNEGILRSPLILLSVLTPLATSVLAVFLPELVR